MAVSRKAMSAVINFFSDKLQSVSSCDSFMIFHEAMRSPTFSGAYVEIDPYQALSDSLAIESVRVRRKKLVGIWNASTKKSRAKKLAYYEAVKDEIDVLTLALKEFY